MRSSSGVEPTAAMITPHRILLAHSDAHTRRILTLLLAEAGLTVQAVDPTSSAISKLTGERFSLALIGDAKPADDVFELCPALRDLQPELPIVLLLPELDLPQVIQGIRYGLRDVLPLRTDPKPVIRRILNLLGVEVEGEPTAAELAEVEATLEQLDPESAVPAADPETLAQRERLWRGLREMHVERELIQAAQAGIDEKARMLRLEREELHRERELFNREVAELREEGAELDREWVQIEEQRRALQDQRDSLAAVEADLRKRERTISETMPPIPAPAKVSGTSRELEQEWDRLERAKASFAAEQAMFRDERMVLTDLDRQIRQKEEHIRHLGDQIGDLDRKRRGLPLPPPKAFAKPALATGATRKPGLFKTLLKRT